MNSVYTMLMVKLHAISSTQSKNTHSHKTMGENEPGSAVKGLFPENGSLGTVG